MQDRHPAGDWEVKLEEIQINRSVGRRHSLWAHVSTRFRVEVVFSALMLIG